MDYINQPRWRATLAQGTPPTPIPTPPPTTVPYSLVGTSVVGLMVGAVTGGLMGFAFKMKQVENAAIVGAGAGMVAANMVKIIERF